MGISKNRIRILITGSLIVFMATLFYIPPGESEPDLLSIKSALVWRQDTQGDYIFEQPVTPGIYDISPTYITQGEIQSITASWKFSGEVTLEVSADNGLHYTPIINGVPLTSGFVKGNNLKWRVTLGANSDVTEVRLAYTDAAGIVGGFGEPRLSGFTTRKKLVILNPGYQNLFNYQLPVRVAESFGAGDYDVHCNGDIEADFEDIRFTTTDGQSLIPHYIESVEGTTPNRIAVVWIKVPQIPPQGLDIYLYYGSVMAEDISSAEAVFDFYDSFEEDGLNLEKWMVKEGIYAVADSELRLDAASIMTKVFTLHDGVVEYRAQADAGDEVRVILRGAQEDLLAATNQTVYSSKYAGVEHCIAVGYIVKANEAKALVPGVTYDYRAILEGTEITFQRYALNFAELEAEIAYDDFGGVTSGNLGLSAGVGCTSYFDWIRLRRYVALPPEVNKTQAQYASAESVKVPSFAGVTLTGNNNLILEEEFEEGSYTSQEVPLENEARLFIPTWRGIETEAGQISLDISVDGGKNFKEDVDFKQYYYASRGDFTAGDELKFKVDLLRREGLSAQFEQLNFDYGPGKILVISPNGGEIWQPGTVETIAWTALEYEPAYPMKIEYSLDKGKTYKVIDESAANEGKFEWTIPEDIESKKAIIRVSDSLETRVYDESDAEFVITKEVMRKVEEIVTLAPEVPQAPVEVIAPTMPEEIPVEVPPEEKPKEKEELDNLIETTKPAGKELYDVVVKIGDNNNPDPAEDAAGCYKHGDVVAIRSTGFDWSENERNSFLILQLYLSPEEANELLKPEEAPTGKQDPSGKALMKTVRRRAKRINLEKIGLSKNEIKTNITTIRSRLTNKALKQSAVVEHKEVK
ncbi:MAG: DUF2341 domain-containing protein [Candidatus Omnitrophota bacterium]